jgi:hypothetical protein
MPSPVTAFSKSSSHLTDFTADPAFWPELPPLAAWKDTYDTLHMWTQIVGKVRLRLSPLLNHWWEVALYVSSRGLTTSPIPYSRGVLEIEFDFLQHQLVLQTSEGARKTMALAPRSVADFYRELMELLRSLDIEVKIWTMPVEIPDPIAFEKDTRHSSYDGAQAAQFWRALLVVRTVFEEFRARFIGKDSPVHFFWGSFDLAVTRFSGRPAPERPGADIITREAYSHEVISAGFWPGGGKVPGPAFYAYAAPEPAGFAQSRILPASAFYDAEMHEVFLMYDDVRRAPSPRATLLEFLQSTYDAAADLAKWDRPALERA